MPENCPQKEIDSAAECCPEKCGKKLRKINYTYIEAICHCLVREGLVTNQTHAEMMMQIYESFIGYFTHQTSRIVTLFIFLISLFDVPSFDMLRMDVKNCQTGNFSGCWQLRIDK